MTAGHTVPYMTDRYDFTGPVSTGSTYLTPSEAAAYLKISPRTLWRWQARGHITPHRLPNGFRRFSLDDVEALFGSRVA